MAEEIIQIGSNKVVTVTNENVGAVLLDIEALQADGTTVCDIADLNEISLEIAVYRHNQKMPKHVCNDYLDYILRGLTAGNLRYTLATTKRSKGYLIAIPFKGCVKLQGNDRMEIKCKINNAAFTTMNNGNSRVTVETVPAENPSPVIECVESVTFQAGDDKVNKVLGNNITKIVLVNDLTADYVASTKAKPTEGINMTANGGYENNASENLLLAQNLDMLQMNPETNVKNLVLYNDESPISGVKLISKFDKAVDLDARIMLLTRKVI